jgi:DNA repair exonuclease SbcCD ATPase subunit
MKLKSFRAIAPLLLLAGCAGAGAGPASERGFFTGIGAAVSGEDVRGAQNLENSAALQERAAQMAAERNTAAQAEAARSTAAVRASEQRLARLQRDLAQQRTTLDRLRAERAQNPAATAEAARLQSELDALERDRRAAAARAGGPSADQVQSIERRAGELDAALQRFGRI